MNPYARISRRARLFEDISQDLLDRIQRGELQAGDRLPPERKLVELYGVSRTAVREALRSLAARGLVESYVGRGTFVRRPTTEHLTEKLRHVLADASTPAQVRSARLLVEAEVAACAAEHGTAATLAPLRVAADAGMRSDAYFAALATAGKVMLLGPVLAALRQLEGDVRSERAALRRLADAVEAGDGDAARDAIRPKRTRRKGEPAPDGESAPDGEAHGAA